MPRFIVPTMVVLVLLGLIPAAFVVYAMNSTSTKPRIHLVHDMDHQQKFKPQTVNPAFADGRSMRRPVEGTVARGELYLDDHLYRGRVGKEWAKGFPMEVSMDLMRRGQERYTIYCATCHGWSGNGNGPTAEKAGIAALNVTSLHSDLTRKREPGHIFNTITNGLGNMASYAAQIPAEDRWAIVAYIRALQRSQNAKIADVPDDFRERLR